MSVIDTNDNVSAHIANLKNRGVTAVGRYYSSSAWKRLTKAEAEIISAAGLKIFVVFENDGDPALTADKGTHHAQIAANQAKGVGQPQGSAIYFALEHLPDGYKKKHVKAIKEYMTGVRAGLGGKYKIGVYSDGVVCDSLLSDGFCEYTWLSASSSFEGSTEFYHSNKWSLAQDSHVDQDWDGLSVDVNEAKPDFGAFQVAVVHAPLSDAGEGLALEAAASPGGSFGARARQTATGEWEFFERQTYDVEGNVEHAGRKEGEDGWYQRIGQYWVEGTNTFGIDGRNHDSPWSAAFISWVMKQSGAGTRFRYSTQHSVYISQAIRDFLRNRQEAGYWGVRLGEARPAVGDLVCWAREDGVDYDHQKGGDYAGHCDVIVEVNGDRIRIIGGNVGNSVTRRPLRLDQNGFVRPTVQHGETLFALMRNRIG
jgi:hypothetical protein